MTPQVIDSTDLLRRATSKIGIAADNLPRFTCAERLNRNVYAPQSVPSTGSLPESAWHILSMFRPGRLAWKDSSGLEVGFFDGAGKFAWAGQREFEFSDLAEMIGGTTTTGQFGPFIISVFLSDADPRSLRFRDVYPASGRELAEYTFRVPVDTSHYQIDVGSGTRVTTGYEGSFSIDVQTAILKRLNVEVRHPPKDTGILAASILINYDWAEIAGFFGLIPVSSTLQVLSNIGSVSVAEAQYGECKAFTSESLLRLDAGSTSIGSRAPDATPPIHVARLPPGLEFLTALLTPIDSDTAVPGDEIRARLVRPVKDSTGRILAPKGAIVFGRMVRLEQRYQPNPTITFAIRLGLRRNLWVTYSPQHDDGPADATA